MLDSTTKVKINTARDILVGKVPDPKSQVEQITIALIYKFMDDMDAETEALGGKRTFFTGKYEKYGWRKIFDPKLSGFDMLNLYSEAIQQMNVIASVPQLFRDIFKNAYLPYRDPETLKAFLKIINEFEYDHSERLGDAFEFLLSVLGSQGDAGQFRTPRHIIDFVVRITDPKKQDKIMDPACGTAGFLISGYKHILKQNSKDGIAGRALTNDDRKRLVQNFRGYDISPDMVRLSLVNMYLHGFTTPHIEEYDTLTSEDKWNEYFDVILANPPFMSPKGGIRPHKRFSVQSNRSEVLFVDYIAEHLSPNGRAAIIVPEGIIFQSGTAYKQLRKLLVEQYLYAVVSLPAGVFNPYSGVKTSVLLLDKTIAKRTDKILFVKIQNDGFDLGAQRRAIDKSDLYFAEELLKYYRQHTSLDNFDSAAAIAAATVQNKKDHAANEEIPLVKIEAAQWLHIAKEKIAENGDWNLSGDRYRENVSLTRSNYEMIELGEIFKLSSGKALTQKNIVIGPYAVFGGNGINGMHNEYFLEEPTLVIGRVGEYCGAVHITSLKAWVTDNGLYVTNYLKEVNQKYLLAILNFINLNQYSKVGGQPSISQSTIYEIQIPFPPLSIQEQIVAEIESYQKVIDGARQVVENYKPNIYIQPEWDVVELGEVCEVKSGGTPSREKKEYWDGGTIPWLRSEACKDDYVFEAKEFITQKGFQSSSAKYLKSNTTLVALVGATIGKTALIKFETTTNQNVAGIYPLDETRLLPQFIFHCIQLLYHEFISLGEFRMATLSFVRSLKISLPPIAEQEAIVQQLATERQLVENNKQLIALMQQKIHATIARVWGGGKTAAKVYEVGEEELSMVAEE